MRLDHLLSREKARREIESLHLRVDTQKCVNEKKTKRRVWQLTVLLLEPVSFSGIERDLKVP